MFSAYVFTHRKTVKPALPHMAELIAQYIANRA
jgi:hypothetical protein